MEWTRDSSEYIIIPALDLGPKYETTIINNPKTPVIQVFIYKKPRTKI